MNRNSRSSLRRTRGPGSKPNPRNLLALIAGLCPLRQTSAVNQRTDQALNYSLNTSLVVVFALLHTADGILTYLGLRFTDVDEANPLLVLTANVMGLGLSIFLLKLLCLSVIAMLFASRRNLGNCWSTASLLGADAFYSWVVGNNLFLVAIA